MYKVELPIQVQNESELNLYAQVFHFPLCSFSTIKTSRDAYIQRLNGIYENLLKKSGVDYVQGWGTFTDDGCVDVDGQKYRGKHTMIAVGGKPTVPDIPGMLEHK